MKAIGLFLEALLLAGSACSAGEDGLLLYYPCDEKNGSVLHDAGPHHKDASLNAVTNGEERGVRIVCPKAGEWVPIINQDGVQRKGIVPGSDAALAEGDRPIVLDRDKDYAIDCTNGLIRALDGGRIEPGDAFTLDFRFTNPGPEWVEGKGGGAVKLDGLDDFVLLGRPDSSGELASFTIELWVRVPKETPLDAVLRFKGVSLSPKPEPVAPQAWHHLAVVVDGKTIAYFLDGRRALAGTTSVVTPLNSVSIGGTRDPFFLAGLVDEIKVYDHARSPAEIAKDAAQ